MSESERASDSLELDLDAYLRRIEYAGDLTPSRATLDALHLAHATHVVFENLDVLLGVPIRLDLASLQALADDDELLEVLAEKFALHFPPQTRFRYRR